MPSAPASLVRSTLLAAASLTFAAAPATAPAAQLSNTSPNPTATCKTASAGPLPAPPIAGPLSPAQLRSCDAEALYYGLGRPADLHAALQCGWYQQSHPDPAVGDMFRGPGVLSMLYANGEDVPRNLDLATRFVCQNEWAAPAELDGRLDHLAHIRQALANQTTPKDLHFDLCDDITSGLSQGTCTSISTRRQSATRDQQIAALLTTLSPAAQSRFPELQAAERRFEQSRARNELDLSGTDRGAVALAEQDTLDQQFLINLQRFSKGNIPDSTPNQLSTLKQQLTDALAHIRQAPASHWQFTTLTPAGIAATEQTHAALTTAWLGFAPAAFPRLSPSALEAQLLRLRLHQLRSLLH